MPTTYQVADDEVTAMVRDRIERSEPDLKDSGAIVGVLLAYNAEGDAIKHGGYRVTACIKVVGARDRVTKRYDAELLIDESEWNTLTPRQRQALIAHELRHLRTVPASKKELAETNDRFKRDDRGRPRLKTVKADFQPSDAFKDIIAEFQDDSLEYHSLRSAWAEADAAKAEGAAA